MPAIVLHAGLVVPIGESPIRDGAVRVEGSRITAVGPRSEVDATDAEVVAMPDRLLMPGLINAHCHLDYTSLRGVISRQRSFTEWIRQINAHKRQMSPDDYIVSIAHGFRQLRRWGTTSVVNMAAFPDLFPHVTPAPLRTWWCYEMLNVRPRQTDDEVIAGALAFFDQTAGALDHFALNPHAPYTASVDLYRLAGGVGKNLGMQLTSHVAESAEEYEMFRHRRGELFDFLHELGRGMDDCGSGSPFARLWQEKAIGPGWLLAHMNTLDDDDFALLAGLPAEELPHVVHTPGSHAYFSHPPFPLRRLRDLGVNVCLGTDSLASTDTLSLFAEMRRVLAREPWLGAQAVVEMTTLNAAQALGRVDLGRIVIGATADLIAFTPADMDAAPYENIVHHAAPNPWLMVDGRIVS